MADRTENAYEDFLRDRRERIGRLTARLSGHPRHLRTWRALWVMRQTLDKELTSIWTRQAERTHQEWMGEKGIA